MAGHTDTKKLRGLRTFRDDLARAQAQGKSDAPEPTGITPAPSVVPPAPKVPKPVVPRVPPTPKAMNAALPKAPAVPTPIVTRTAPAQTVTKIESQHASPAFVTEDLEKIRSHRRKSVLATDDTFDVDTAHAAKGEGSIITDTKRARFNLFQATGEAFKEWLFEKKEEFEENRKPKYTIAPSAKRAEIIERAVKTSATAPRDDHSVVAERLRTVPRVKATTGLSVKKVAEVAKPTWSHTDQKSESNIPTQTKDAIPTNRAPDPVQIVQHTPAPPRVRTPVPASVPQPTQVVQPQVAKPQTPKPEPVAVPAQEPVRPTPPPAPVPPSAPRTPRPVTASVTHRVSKRTPFTSLVVIGVIASVLGILVSVWFFSFGGNVVPEPESTNTLLNADAELRVLLAGTHSALMANFAEATTRAGTQSVTYFVPVTSVDEAVPATMEQLLAVFSPRAPSNFVRNITGIGYGTYRGSEPFIILKVTAFDTALGGMLAWEQSMSADLAPFFGTPVTSTFDPYARTATQTSSAFFVDEVHENRDVRILRDSEQNERIVYTFIDRSTIIITTDTSIIGELARLLQ